VVALAMLLWGCAALEQSGPVASAPGAAAVPARWPTEAERALDRAGALSREGRADEAMALYASLAAAPARDAVHARALYEVARLHLDPGRGRPDHRAADAALERLLAEYPPGDWLRDAGAWRAVLAQLFALEDRAAGLDAEARRLRAQLSARSVQSSRLKAELGARDAEAARLRDEAARLRTALDRLKQIDLDVDRRR
jgi:hypothetical protein